MREKFNLGQLKKAISFNKKTPEKFKELEEEWNDYDSGISQFGNTFLETLPPKYTRELFEDKNDQNIEKAGIAFRDYIEDSLKKNDKKERTAIEFGGTGAKLFSGFSNGFFKKTIGVCLDDVRHKKKYPKEEKEKGHSVITGDCMDIQNNGLYKNVNKELGVEKADLIISRMMGGVDGYIKNPVILDIIIRKWYSLLDKGGVLFAQFEFIYADVPYFQKEEHIANSLLGEIPKQKAEEDVEEWVKAIQKRFSNEIEVQLGRGIIRIQKKEGAPNELPKMKELFS